VGNPDDAPRPADKWDDPSMEKMYKKARTKIAKPEVEVEYKTYMEAQAEEIKQMLFSMTR
jgi:hypothetical protein